MFVILLLGVRLECRNENAKKIKIRLPIFLTLQSKVVQSESLIKWSKPLTSIDIVQI